MTPSPFGRSLKRLRERRQLSPEDLAKRTGIHAQVIRKLEYGENQWPRLDTALKIAEALGADVAGMARE